MCVQFTNMLVFCISLQLIVAASTDRNRKDEIETRGKGDFAFPDDAGVLGRSRENLMMGHHHHHHHGFHHPYHDPDFHHDPEFHRKHDHMSEDFDLEGEKPKETEFNNASFQIPLDYIQDLNKYSVNDLLANFVVMEGNKEPGTLIESRFGDDESQERNAATMPKGAECMPELKTVELISTDDPSILYIPQCTRVEQCGGCCKHDLLSCQPVKKEVVPFKVHKTQYTGEKKLKYLGAEVIMVEKHNKCKCLCRVKKEDCTKFQEYKESECRCVCRNYDEKEKCLRNNETKLWNPELCTCQCRDSIECSTGSYFDQNECRCLATNKRLGNYQKRSYRFEPLPVVPLNEEY